MEKHIVSGSNDKLVWVWDASTGEELKELKGHTALVRLVAFSPDGKHIVSGSDNKLVQVWDAGSCYIRERILDSNCHEQYTGWLLSSYGPIHLMFVPPEDLLSDTSNVLTIPCSACSYVDFTHATLGPQWEKCYHM